MNQYFANYRKKNWYAWVFWLTINRRAWWLGLFDWLLEYFLWHVSIKTPHYESKTCLWSCSIYKHELKQWTSVFLLYSFRLRLLTITKQTIRKKNRISIEFSKKIAKFNENCLFVAHHQSSLGLTMMVLFQCIRNGTRSTNIEYPQMSMIIQHMTISPCCCSKEVFLISSS